LIRSSCVAWAIVISTGCGVDEGAGDGPATLFEPGVTRVIVELDVQEGAEPRFESASGVGKPWDLVAANARALFEGRDVEVPRGMADVELLSIGAESFSAEDIAHIAEVAREPVTDSGERSLYLLFLDGHFREDGRIEEEVLGVSLRSRGIIAMFGPSLRSQASSGLAEQIAVVHEIGHAIGLVDSGIEMVSEHRDRAHGHHCDNPSCVMDYRYEGGRETTLNLSGSGILFGSECLDDVYAAYQE